jgi:hypothetical protein
LGSEFPLIVGGGYGLVLRQRHLREERVSTRRAYLAARSTQDIDLFLKLEMLLDPQRTEQFRAALDSLGYRPIESAKYYQFVRELEYRGQTRSLKIDLLARTPESSAEQAALKADSRRVRNRSFRELHAHATPEAVTVEELLLPVTLDDGGQHATVYVPHPFSYLLLKLFALRDQVDNPAKLYGRHHAFDIFCTVAMMTRTDWEGALFLRIRFSAAAPVMEARVLVHTLFGSLAAPGVQRLVEHVEQTGSRIPVKEIEEFRWDLGEVFAAALHVKTTAAVDSGAASG